MKKLSLKTLKKNLHYNPNTGLFTWIIDKPKVRKGLLAGTKRKDGYVRIKINNIAYYAHDLAWFYMTNKWPKDYIDHINRIKNDNRWCNLRECSSSENKINSFIYKNNESGYKGVGWHKELKKWRARITYKGKLIHLGFFDAPEVAAKEYLKAAERLYGEYAKYEDREV